MHFLVIIDSVLSIVDFEGRGRGVNCSEVVGLH